MSKNLNILRKSDIDVSRKLRNRNRNLENDESMMKSMSMSNGRIDFSHRYHQSPIEEIRSYEGLVGVQDTRNLRISCGNKVSIAKSRIISLTKDSLYQTDPRNSSNHV
jgi:hypothetical protein